MFWIRSALQGISISDWLTPAPVAAPDPADALEDARDALHKALAASGCGSKQLEMRIRTAPDLHSLWALRPEVMTALSRAFGEREARRQLAAITTCFEGLLPAAAPRARRMPASAFR